MKRTSKKKIQRTSKNDEYCSPQRDSVDIFKSGVYNTIALKIVGTVFGLRLFYGHVKFDAAIFSGSDYGLVIFMWMCLLCGVYFTFMVSIRLVDKLCDFVHFPSLPFQRRLNAIGCRSNGLHF